MNVGSFFDQVYGSRFPFPGNNETRHGAEVSRVNVSMFCFSSEIPI